MLPSLPINHNFEAGQTYELVLIGKSPTATLGILKVKSNKVVEKIATIRKNALFEKR